MSQKATFQKSSVCRRLVFDDEDAPTPEERQINAADDQAVIPEHLEEARLDNVRNTFVEELQRSRNQSKEKWNFDFETETPLDGNWEWEKVENDNEIIGDDRINGRVDVQHNDKFRDENSAL